MTQPSECQFVVAGSSRSSMTIALPSGSWWCLTAMMKLSNWQDSTTRCRCMARSCQTHWRQRRNQKTFAAWLCTLKENTTAYWLESTIALQETTVRWVHAASVCSWAVSEPVPALWMRTKQPTGWEMLLPWRRAQYSWSLLLVLTIGTVFNNCPTRCDLFSLLYFCRRLCMFASTTVRSRCWVGC